MAETIEKSQLIDINGLSVFKEKMDASVNTKIAEAGQGVTYTLSRNSNNEIVLTGSDKSETKVTDENTTYSFTQFGTVLTITPSDGEPIKVTLGGDITEETISGWGFTKNTGTYSKPSDGIPKADLSNDVQSSLDNAELIGDLNTDVTALKGTTIIGTLSAGQTSLVLSNSAITTDSTIDYYVDRFGVSATNVVVTTGKITMTFKAQSSALNVKVIVR